MDKDYFYEVFTSPISLICQVFTYGKKDSLSDFLKTEGYVLSLSCHSFKDINKAELVFSMVPTEKGYEDYQEIVRIIFSYIKKVKKEFDFGRYYKEIS